VGLVLAIAVHGWWPHGHGANARDRTSAPPAQRLITGSCCAMATARHRRPSASGLVAPSAARWCPRSRPLGSRRLGVFIVSAVPASAPRFAL
jgi:hypothetical protein